MKAITPRCCKVLEEPTWSPNGKRIAFVRGRNLFTINTRCKQRDRVTRGTHFDGKPFHDGAASWSPDGNQIVFARAFNNGDNDLFMVDANGSNLRPIETQGIAEFDPAWSPDGEWIAFWAAKAEPGLGEEFGIHLMRSDGSDVQLVVELLNQNSELGDWSPGGGLLAFSNRMPGIGPEIYTVRPDGTQQTKLTDERRPAFGPAFSPQGDRIAFAAGGALKLMDTDGGNVKRLLKKRRRRDFPPDWQPR